MVTWDKSCSEFLLHVLFTFHSFHINTREVSVIIVVIVIIVIIIIVVVSAIMIMIIMMVITRVELQ